MPIIGVSRRGLVLGAASLLAMPAIARAQSFVERTERATFRVSTVAEGLESPWSLAFLPDGDMLVTEKPGRLRIIRNGSVLRRPVGGLPPELEAIGQGGLLDVVPHPRFADNRLVYLSYAASADGGHLTRVAVGRLEEGDLADTRVLLSATPAGSGGRHFGSRIVFHPDGTLFVTFGERGSPKRAQRLDDFAGTVARINDDGSIPADNPFVGRTDVPPAIYSYGHRNPQGMALQPGTDRIWLHEHGPRGGDEVNIVRPGRNYGWPEITYGVNYSGSKISDFTAKPGMEQPEWYWVPSIAPSGMAFSDSDQFPGWRSNILVGALRARLLARLTVEDNKVVAEERMLTNMGARIRDVRQGPDGLVYLLTDAWDGAVLTLRPVG